MTLKQEKEFYEKKRLNKEPYTRQVKLGMWEIFDGENMVWTGDGGYKEFRDKLTQAVNDEIKKIKNDLRNNSKRFD